VRGLEIIDVELDELLASHSTVAGKRDHQPVAQGSDAEAARIRCQESSLGIQGACSMRPPMPCRGLRPPRPAYPRRTGFCSRSPSSTKYS
jgi:hypothetical protein